MTESPDEWVCLECYNRWEPRSEPDGKAQCSNADCRSRFTFPYPLIEEHVAQIRSVIDEQPHPVGEKGKSMTPFQTLPRLLDTGHQMIQETDRPRAQKGLDLLGAMRELVAEWKGEGEEPLRDAIDRLHEQSGDTDADTE